MKGRPDAPPIVVVGTRGNALRVIAHEADAHARGFFPGQPVGDARALCPQLDCVEHDEAADGALLNALAAWCDRYTPLVARDGADGLFLDISGCAHLFGGEEALLDDMQDRLRAQGLQARLCVADSAGAARAMARFTRARRLAPGDIEPVLDLPLAALRIAPQTAASLARVGLRTVGCIAYLPRAPLVARFGEELARRLDQALGRADEPLSFLQPVAALMSEKRFSEPIAREDDIRAAIAELCAGAVPSLERRGQGARQMSVKFFRVDGEVFALGVHAANPLRDPVRMAALFEERLAALREDFDAGYGFDMMRLDIMQADTFADAQGDILDRRGEGDSLARLIDRLGARLGADRVRVFAHADTHVPERGFALVPLARAGAACRGPAPEPDGERAPGRPLWLLERPEPLDVVAEVPDGPPLRFRWRRVSYVVTRSEGPERIACEWWRDGRGALSRDYYKVEDERGHRLWLFRHGLYGRETNRPRWFMHGVFA